MVGDPQGPTLAAGCRRRCPAPACGHGCVRLRGSCKTWRCGHSLRWRLWCLVATLPQHHLSSSTEQQQCSCPCPCHSIVTAALSQQQRSVSKLNQSNYELILCAANPSPRTKVRHASAGWFLDTPFCSATCLGHLRYSASFPSKHCPDSRVCLSGLLRIACRP